jgi:ATP-dependent protease Clp ATPase subunit
MEKLNCTLCKKSEEEVAVLCAWPVSLFICDECVGLMVHIIAEKNKEWRDRQIEALTKLNVS